MILRNVVRRWRELPEERRMRAAALLNDIGKAQVAVGDFASAQADFRQAAASTPDPAVRAEAHQTNGF